MNACDLRVFEEFINPWIGGADIDELCDRYCELDSNDAVAVAAAIKSDLLPGYCKFDGERRSALKAALSKAAVASEYFQGRIWDCQLPPFDLPDRKANLFLWMTAVIESYEAESSDLE